MVTTETLPCLVCGSTFERVTKRGRKPLACPACVDKAEKEREAEAAAARADTIPRDPEQARIAREEKADKRLNNLEMMLRSRGTHIQQNPPLW